MAVPGRRADMSVGAERDPRFERSRDRRRATHARRLPGGAARDAGAEVHGPGSGLVPTVRSAEPSTLSLLGLIRHLADVERRWFRSVLAGQEAPPLFSSTARPDGDFDGAVPDPSVVAAAWRAWRAEVTFAEHFVTEAPALDLVGHDAWRGTVSLRWVLIHMVEEYARHNGHADLLRERIDGAIGL